MSAAVAFPVMSSPTDTFRCAQFRCELAAKACLARQDARRKTSRLTFPAYCTCGPSKAGEPSPCAQGREVRAQLGNPPPAEQVLVPADTQLGLLKHGIKVGSRPTAPHPVPELTFAPKPFVAVVKAVPSRETVKEPHDRYRERLVCRCGRVFGDPAEARCRVCRIAVEAGLAPCAPGSWTGTPENVRERHRLVKRAWGLLHPVPGSHHPLGPAPRRPCMDCGSPTTKRRCRNCAARTRHARERGLLLTLQRAGGAAEASP